MEENKTENISNKTSASRYFLKQCNFKPLYILPEDPFAEEVLITGFQAADKVDCMVGFFSSAVLKQIAPGLASYIASHQNSFRLIISPFLSEADQMAIESETSDLEKITENCLQELVITKDLLEQHTLYCLSYLLKVSRIEIKVALVKDALFHPKVWLFEQNDNVMATHGSSNSTYAGIKKNVENMSISCSWVNSEDLYTVKKFQKEFDCFWNNKKKNCVIIDLPKAIREKIIKVYSAESPPTEVDFRTLYDKAHAFEKKGGELENELGFHIPAKLEYETGPFEHQGKAVEAWHEKDCRGILEMATGSGKTITAMICAHKLYEENKPLLIVVTAPYIPLVQQWCEEIKEFGLSPIDLTQFEGDSSRAKEINQIRRSFEFGNVDAKAFVGTHETLKKESFQDELKKFKCNKLLIADEVHNLGAEGFLVRLPSFFDYRLGLSATPVRQYDQEGTEALISFFGPSVFTFGLKEAIEQGCLVEYDYYVHPVELTQEETNYWLELTAKIKKASASKWQSKNEKPEAYITNLCIKRRKILDTAENKLVVLEAVLKKEGFENLYHTIIYASDKDPNQLKAVNALLSKYQVPFHQITQEETRTRNRDQTNKIIQSFKEGRLHVLTAKLVLDEGVNIPQIQKAFILASTTVKRQWIQRRGRLLRTCHETDKTHSIIHDFIVMPPDGGITDEDARNFAESELNRVREFAILARNTGSSDGPLKILSKLAKVAFL